MAERDQPVPPTVSTYGDLVIDCPTDPAVDIVVAYTAAMREAFTPSSSCPPAAGSDDVRFIAGEGPALVAFDVHTRGNGKCKQPFLWVRLARRYRTGKDADLIQPVLDNGERCDSLPRVVAIEVGVARCSVAVDERAGWDKYEYEAQQSMDDSWRLELALCRAAGKLRAVRHEVATDVLNPVGPDGGLIGWIGTAYIRI